MKIKSVLIVGGGTSGWMTAASLSMHGLDVSLVESKSVPTVGVGESTILGFNRFLQSIRLKDQEWMKACNATYKNSIRFTDFYKKGTSFDYPFDKHLTEEGIGEWALMSAKYDLPPESFCEYFSDNYFLAKHNRNTKGDSNFEFNFEQYTAYHIDAKLFGEFIKNNASRITHYYDDIVGVTKDENGYLTSVVGQDTYTADLYVDCTGFQSLLLEKEMGSEFTSFKPWLSNDRAIACNLPYSDKEKELTNVTNCTALSSGWSWNIPLWNRMGTGYVYSSDFISDDDAEKEFVKYLGTDDLDFNKINIRHGVREKAWVKNVVGIGLSYAFVEPLESTSLVSTHDNIFYLTELLERKNYDINGFSIDGFNYLCKTNIARNRDFVALHYKLSSRTDTPYWRHQSEKNWPQQDYGTNKGIDYYNDMHRIHSLEHRWIPQAETEGFFYILAGMGEKPFGKILLAQLMGMGYAPASSSKLEELYNDYRKEVDKIDTYIKTLPSSYEFLKKHIYS